jgi:hypothetical protein
MKGGSAVFLHTGTGNLLVPFIGFTGCRACTFKQENDQQHNGQDQFHSIEIPVQDVIHHDSM